MNNNPNVTYLLLYAANMDSHISIEEKELILKHLKDDSQWQDLLQEFEKMNEKEKADRVMDILNAADENEKRNWMQAVKELMKADGKFSGVEQYLLGLMKK